MSEDWWCRWETTSVSTVNIPEGDGVTFPDGDISAQSENRKWVCTWIGKTTPGGTTQIYASPGGPGKGGPRSTGGPGAETITTAVEVGLAAGQLATCTSGGTMARIGRSFMSRVAIRGAAIFGIFFAASEANIGADIDGTEHYIERTTARPTGRPGRASGGAVLGDVAEAGVDSLRRNVDDVARRIRYRSTPPRC